MKAILSKIIQTTKKYFPIGLSVAGSHNQNNQVYSSPKDIETHNIHYRAEKKNIMSNNVFSKDFRTNNALLYINDKIFKIFDQVSDKLFDNQKVLKQIALRETLIPRIFFELEILFQQPLLNYISKYEGTSLELQKFLKDRYMYNSMTMHPTEGRTPQIIKNQYIMENIAIIIAKVKFLNLDGRPTALDAENLRSLGMKGDNIIDMPSVEELCHNPEIFDDTCNRFMKVLMEQYVDLELGHPKKMTKDQEIDLLLFWGEEYQKKLIKTLIKVNDAVGDELIDYSFLNSTNWALDRDGKKEIDAMHSCKFTFLSQDRFFTSVIYSLDKIKNLLEFDNKSTNQLNDLKQYISDLQIQTRNNFDIFTTEQISVYKNEIIEKLQGIYIGDHPEISYELQRLHIFIDSSQLRIFKQATSREEVIETHRAMQNIINKELDENHYDELLNEIINTPEKIVGSLINNHNFLTKETWRQIACHITTQRFHQKHEQIMSQFDCKISSFKENMAINSIAKEIFKNHQKFPILKELFNNEQYQFYNTVFSEEATKDVINSHTDISALPEELEYVEGLVDFYKTALKDPIIYKHLKKSGGIYITVSKSDGSESMGSYKEPYASSKNIIKLQNLCDEYNIELHVLYGVGANDPERLAYHGDESIKEKQTLQGGNIPSFVNLHRIESALIRSDKDLNIKKLTHFLIDPENQKFIEAFANQMYQNHKKIYFGETKSTDQGRTDSGRLLFRGRIVMDIQNILTRASARGATRSEEKQKETNILNKYDQFKDELKTLRRIGTVNTNRIAGMAPFLFESFFEDQSKSFDEKKIFELHKIPMFRDLPFSGLLGIATADVETFLLLNGFHGDDKLSPEDIEKYAKEFEENYQNSNTDLDLGSMRKQHMSYILYNLKGAVRNAVTPLIYEASDETKNKIAKICDKIERIPANQTGDIFDHIIDIALIAKQDRNLDDNLKLRFNVLSYQTSFTKTAITLRKVFAETANYALETGDQDLYQDTIEQFAVLIRGSGNPFGKGGRHNQELNDYYHARYNEQFAVRQNVLKVEYPPKYARSFSSKISNNMGVMDETPYKEMLSNASTLLERIAREDLRNNLKNILAQEDRSLEKHTREISDPKYYTYNDQIEGRCL